MHRPSDYPSLLLYILDETHVTVTAATALAILFTQNAHVCFFASGALASTLLARAIKHTIKQPRPPPPPSESKPAPVRPKRTFGMPSTHSTALAFYLFYLFPLLPLASDYIWAERIALMGIAGLTLWSRVELGYHTEAQVLGGVTVGLVSAKVWAALWTTYPLIGLRLQDAIDTVRAAVLGFL